MRGTRRDRRVVTPPPPSMMQMAPGAEPSPTSGTADSSYSARLARLEGRRWKRVFDVQRPYRWNIRRLRPGFVLDVGCGLGRNLAHLDGRGVGVDHNAESVRIARARGLDACTPEEFAASPNARPGRFDSLLAAHVIEHLDGAAGEALLAGYLPYVRAGGQVIVVCPQEAGFRSDATHVTYLDASALVALAGRLGLEQPRVRSFPFPAVAGRLFRYNEFVLVARTPGG
jgi:SAM-dependent methyltransferase